MPSANSGARPAPHDPGPHRAVELVIPSDPAEARRIQTDIEQLLKDHHCGERDVFGVKLALEEALVNAIKHGNQMDRAKKVHVAYRLAPGHFEVHITDEGAGFDPCDVPDPCAPEPGAPLRPGPHAHAPLHERGRLQRPRQLSPHEQGAAQRQIASRSPLGEAGARPQAAAPPSCYNAPFGALLTPDP